MSGGMLWQVRLEEEKECADSNDVKVSRLDSRRLLMHSGQFGTAESDWPPTAGVADRAVPV